MCAMVVLLLTKLWEEYASPTAVMFRTVLPAKYPILSSYARAVILTWLFPTVHAFIFAGMASSHQLSTVMTEILSIETAALPLALWKSTSIAPILQVRYHNAF